MDTLYSTGTRYLARYMYTCTVATKTADRLVSCLPSVELIYDGSRPANLLLGIPTGVCEIESFIWTSDPLLGLKKDIRNTVAIIVSYALRHDTQSCAP